MICSDQKSSPSEIVQELRVKISKKNFACSVVQSENRDLPKHIQKFYRKRFFLFKRFSEGIMLDEESWYSVIPEDMSVHISEKLFNAHPKAHIIDGFCGSGGLAIQLAQRFQNVTCIDIDPIKIKNITNNLNVYGQKADVRCMSFFDFKPDPAQQKDYILVMCPPWGGMNYQQQPFNLRNIKLKELLQKAFQVTDKIVIQLPKNISVQQLVDIFSDVHVDKSREIEIEQLLINDHVNQLIIYYI